MPVSQVGLEVAALGPLVPGIQEHDPVLGRLGARPVNRFAEPCS